MPECFILIIRANNKMLVPCKMNKLRNKNVIERLFEMSRLSGAIAYTFLRLLQPLFAIGGEVRPQCGCPLPA